MLRVTHPCSPTVPHTRLLNHTARRTMVEWDSRVLAPYRFSAARPPLPIIYGDQSLGMLKRHSAVAFPALAQAVRRSRRLNLLSSAIEVFMLCVVRQSTMFRKQLCLRQRRLQLPTLVQKPLDHREAMPQDPSGRSTANHYPTGTVGRHSDQRISAPSGRIPHVSLQWVALTGRHHLAHRHARATLQTHVDAKSAGRHVALHFPVQPRQPKTSHKSVAHRKLRGNPGLWLEGVTFAGTDLGFSSAGECAPCRPLAWLGKEKWPANDQRCRVGSRMSVDSILGLCGPCLTGQSLSI